MEKEVVSVELRFGKGLKVFPAFKLSDKENNLENINDIFSNILITLSEQSIIPKDYNIGYEVLVSDGDNNYKIPSRMEKAFYRDGENFPKESDDNWYEACEEFDRNWGRYLI